MTPDAELTLSQLQMMTEIANNLPTFIISLPNPYLDNADIQQQLVLTNSEVDQLVDLMFLEDVTKHSQVMMDELAVTTGHRHRIFHVTKVGLAFFRLPREEDGTVSQKPLAVN